MKQLKVTVLVVAAVSLLVIPRGATGLAQDTPTSGEEDEAGVATTGDESPSSDDEPTDDTAAVDLSKEGTAEEESANSNDSTSAREQPEGEVAKEKEKAEIVAPAPATPPAKKQPGKKSDKRKVIRFGARLHGGWSLEHRRDTVTELDSSGNEVTTSDYAYENEFYVKRARLKVEITPVKWLLGVAQVDVSEAMEGSLLRDAYVHLSPARQFQLRVGQFKKPFSGLELRSPSKRRLISRGPGNDLIIENLGFGDRDLGLQASGRLVKSVRLDYTLGVFNGSGPNLGDPGLSKDIVARLQIRPVKQLTIGANGSFKWFSASELQTGKPDWAWAAGLDSRLQIKGFRLSIEGLVGQNHLAYIDATDSSSISADNPPEFINATAVISYMHSFDISWGFAIEPAAKGELLEPTTVFVDDHVLSLAVGLNTYFGKYFRLMINGEFIRSGRNSASDFPDQEVLMVLACFDL